MAQNKFSEDFSQQLAKYRQVNPMISAMMRSMPNVFGTMIGPKIVKAKITNQISIIALVNKKIPVSKLQKNTIIPKIIKMNIEGEEFEIITDILESQMPRFAERTDASLPAKGGDSVGLNRANSAQATISFAAKNNDDDAPGFVTAAHALMIADPLGNGWGKPTGNAANVIKPAFSCGGGNIIGSVNKMTVSLLMQGTPIDTDAAFVKVNSINSIQPSIEGINWDHKTYGSPYNLSPGTKVIMSGSSSGIQSGEIIFYDGVLPMMWYDIYGMPTGVFAICHDVYSFLGIDIEGGDSGACVFTKDNTTGENKAIAMVVGFIDDTKIGKLTCCFDISTSLKQLGVRPWNAPAPDVLPPPPTWTEIFFKTSLLSGENDPVNIALNNVRKEFKNSDVGIGFEKWYKEIKRVSSEKKLNLDEKQFAIAMELTSLGRRLIQKDGKLSKNDIELIKMGCLAIEKAGAPAPKDFIENLIARLKKAEGRHWQDVVNELIKKRAE